MWRWRRTRVVGGFLLPVSRLVGGVVWRGRGRRVLMRWVVRGGGGCPGATFQKESFFLFIGNLPPDRGE